MSYVPKILIVDDEARMRDSLKILLSNEGYNIQTGCNGKEAIECLNKDSYDIVLLDMIMPGMNGHQVMDFIKSHYPDTLVIIMTGHASVESAVECLKMGAHDYLRKPFDFEQLLARVKNTINQIKLKKEHELVNGRLKVTEQRYRYLVDASPDIIYTLNPEGEITFINGAAESLLGRDTEQLVNKHYTDIVFKDDIDKAKYHFNERRTGSRATSGVELRLKKSDNGHDPEKCLIIELKSMGIYDKPVNGTDKTFIGTYGVARDVGDRKRLEAQLLQAQKMEAIGTLAGGIAHDFNNLLMGIMGRISLISHDIDLTHPHYKHLKSIEDIVGRGSDLTKQLLGFAMGGKYEAKPTDINELIEKCSDMFGRTRKETRIHTIFQKDVCAVEIDQSQIEQVLLNLFVNAWHAMPEGGDIFIHTKNVTLDDEDVMHYGIKPGKYVMVSVTDTGVGMDEETQQHIFEPFFTTKKLGRGTGLGLASAYGIIKNHGGIINVNSKKGEGTTFNFHLPIVEAQVVKSQIDDTEEEILYGTETILIVDDEDMVITVSREMLNNMGYDVFIARGGKEALEIFKKDKNKIALVILDMIMPDLGGSQVYDVLKEIKPDIKVLLSSGYSIDGQASKIMSRDCDGFIQKPFNMIQLSKRIRNILDK
ncbi:MAG: response regulator [Proteobacteria bacterium]|nr:response regulator [Pseudomonadota bacterium]MBU4389517.1 response regulator [Pseudomonadota bacterium]MBU4420504.1 response regulator [Pseudomonadota bacterium]MBU4503592.1 response regulator [Pseudomonadota bacterium]